MTPEEVRADYRSAMNEAGETITIRRYTGTGQNRPFFDADVMARPMGYRPAELVGGIQQGDTKLIVLAEDLIEAQFPLPKSGEKGLKAIIGGREKSIEAIDDQTRRIQGVLIAYEMTVRGD